MSSRPIRHLVVVLGDQLNRDASALDGFDAGSDRVWMAEAADESTRVWSHKHRIVLFLSAMRHFRDALRKDGRQVDYTALDEAAGSGSLGKELKASLARLKPGRVIMAEPGEWRVRELVRKACEEAGVGLEIRNDRHFLCTVEEFREHAEGRKELRMEYFYREMRMRHGILMDDGKPAGGAWNFDRENRKAFGKFGPGELPGRLRSRPDKITREVIALVERVFPGHPGSVDSFAWPVTRRSALAALRRFVDERLSQFGDYQDAMWSDEPFLYHSLVSSSLNLKLLDPREVIEAAEQAWQSGAAPLPAVEGFIRQILGWREYVRGIYWSFMPDYIMRNALGAEADLPAFFWTGETPMNCLRQAIGQTLEHGYAHHIQRLMVTGLYCLLLGVRPRAVHEWYLAVYVDAVEWVELPNTLGMSQYGDGGVMASKPYCASGKYIDRMSNYCADCAFHPGEATGDSACPLTTLYWDFLIRNEEGLRSNHRMGMQLRNLGRLSAERREGILARAAKVHADPSMSGG